MNKKILIIGNSAKEYALAKILSFDNEVFVAPGSDTIKDFANCIDIREDAIEQLLDFVMENDIFLTITSSKKAINSNISEIFQKNNLQIFAPTNNSARLIFDKAALKKMLYSLRIPTPKFGIFEKQNLVFDYIKKLKYPFVIKTNEECSATIHTTEKTAKNIVENCLSIKGQKIIIEDYIWGTPFVLYAITDGYKALPIGSSLIYRHSLDGNGGQLTNGMGACSPNYKLSQENEFYIMDNIVYPILDSLEIEGNPYCGILGVNGILTEDGSVQVLGLENFTLDCDTFGIWDNINLNLVDLLTSCVVGSFSDEYDYIPQKDLSSTSVVLNCNSKDNKFNVINGLENIEDDTNIAFFPTVNKNRYLEYEANQGQVAVLTGFARTLSSATNKVYNSINEINYKGVYYRKDICKSNIERF